MAAREPHGDSAARSNDLASALVNALHSAEPASAWNTLRDHVCDRVRIMRRAGESKVTVIDTLTGIARQALTHEAHGRELRRIAEDLIIEVSLWCIDEYDRPSDPPIQRPDKA